jgi:hypothetical protein
MTTNDLHALLRDAMYELDVMGSYFGHPETVWPTLGLKVTAAAHQRLAARIKEALDAEPSEDIPLREENLALRAALRSQANEEDWRKKYLLAEGARVKAQIRIDRLEWEREERDEARSELNFIQKEYAKAIASDLTRDALAMQNAALKLDLDRVMAERDDAESELTLHKQDRLRLRAEDLRLRREVERLTKALEDKP